mgnify:CR=1 FL=1
MINIYPKTCNLCGGEVIYTSNEFIYGKPYGSGKVYFCTKCGAYVGTHAKYHKRAFGLLANARMRKGKSLCHQIFDSKWRGKKKASNKRAELTIG